MKMGERHYRLLAEVSMHLNGGYSRLRLLTTPGGLELPTEKIPQQFRALGSKVVVAFSSFTPQPTDSIDDIRHKLAESPWNFFEPTDEDLTCLEKPWAQS
jgi:hypothetical protein